MNAENSNTVGGGIPPGHARRSNNRCARFGLWWGVFLLLTFSCGAESLPDWQPKKAPLMTRWAAEVGPTNAWPEYPRPQLVRPDWLNLNGVWKCALSPDSAPQAPPFQWSILVPYPIESALSGVMTNLDEHGKLWYRRSFSVPETWRERRVQLHFGAVDWSCEVWLNGRFIGRHQGGYDAFTFDITDALRWNAPEEITVAVTDPTEGDQPRGKQSRHPEGIFYTSTSGIWQTVWLEPVPAVRITKLKTLPDVDNKVIRVWALANSLAEDFHVQVVVSAEGKEIARIDGAPNVELSVPLPEPHLWTPKDPFLYDVRVVLLKADETVDSVTSYFGMRKVAVAKDEHGVTRIALNNQFPFLIGTIDQGFWPDGVYTAPTDEALRYDIEYLKKAGFNLTRKHVKVEPDRWYYWTDKLGLLVWQDLPSANNATVEGRFDFESEARRMIEGLENHPSIITWVLFNEGWGQYDTESLTTWLKTLDPSRLVDNASGWTDMRGGDVADVHSYPGPDGPAPETHRAAVLGDFGGLGMTVTNHTWSARNWGYVLLSNPKELTASYQELLKRVWRLHVVRGLSAAIYTQTTDVETECNGLLTYDRAVSKMDPADLAAANSVGYVEVPMKVILPDGFYGQTAWHYTFEKPADSWFKPGFDTSGWKEGNGGFGSAGTPGIVINSNWNTADIWLCREFSLKPEEISDLRLHVFHDEETEIYLNGVLALRLGGFITDYDQFEITREATAALHPGPNSIAVHCHQTTGGQGIDVGICVPRIGQ